ncbi:MAG: hypothetical protein Q7L19_10400 [Pseudohongiella sp.]|nr:hypothetical protein [Pseudohongiella sp.]
MARYCVNKNAQPNGDHEVHNLSTGCSKLPLSGNQLFLGDYSTCSAAVVAAKKIYSRSDGCAYCSPACHSR